MDKLKVNISAHLDIDQETEQKIKNFTKALKELPKEITVNIKIDENLSDKPLTINLGELLLEQVKDHFKTSRLSMMVNEIFNAKPREEVALGLTGTSIIPSKCINEENEQ